MRSCSQILRSMYSQYVYASHVRNIIKTLSLIACLGVAITSPLVNECKALPSFARQLDTQCIACHTEFPILTDMGRQFKLSGYTMSAENTDFPPIAFMLMPSFTMTQKGQDGGAAPNFHDNNNFAVSQFSVFYAGRLFGPYATKAFDPSIAAVLNKFGIFSQTTYDGISKNWYWDNTDIRYADMGSVAGHTLQYGLSLNNNPTVEDLWNTVPAWGFPFSQSGLAPTPAAGTVLDGGLAQQVGGLNFYTMIDSHLYIDVGEYRTINAKTQKSLGIDPSSENKIKGLAPYWRLAYTQTLGNYTVETGVFGLSGRVYPGGDNSSGTDKFTDIGLDSEIQTSFDKNDLTYLVTLIREDISSPASLALGDTSHKSDNLTTLKTSFDYLWNKTAGGAVQYFYTQGSNNPLLYSSSQTGSPNSNGFIFQLNYMPLNLGTGPAAWPRSNVKISLQYVAYNRFDGSVNNIDGAGRKASDNNTLYLETWIAF